MLARWDLVADGEPITTPSSLLLAVRHNGEPAMLKIAREEEERRGGACWLGGTAMVPPRSWRGHGEALAARAGNRGSVRSRKIVAAGATTRPVAFCATRLCACMRGAASRRRDLVPLVRWFEALGRRTDTGRPVR